MLQNRMACGLLLAVPVIALALRTQAAYQESTVPGVCYIVYWEEDEWIETLAAAAQCERQSGGLPVEVCPVTRFTDVDGGIRYPPQSHSIQIRVHQTTPGGPPHYLIWFWHAGSDRDVLWPFAQWFWRQTSHHFSGRHWDVQNSGMRPELVVFGRETHFRIDEFLDSVPPNACLILTALFLAAGHLPSLGFAEVRHGGQLHSLVITPAGWFYTGMAFRMFYGTLAVGLVAVSAALADSSTLQNPVGFVLVVLLSTTAYLGLALTLASRCGSVASTSAGLVIYGTVSALMLGALAWLDARVGWNLSDHWHLEASLINNLRILAHETWSLSELMPLAVFAVLWQIAGTVSFRRLRRTGM